MSQSYTEINELSSKILGCAFDIHTYLGPGLLESTYKECLYYKLTKSGLFVEREKPVPLVFEDIKLECGFRIDLLVEHSIVIELKAVEALNEVHFAQTLTYLKIGGFPLGLLINFNVKRLKDGIKRVIL